MKPLRALWAPKVQWGAKLARQGHVCWICGKRLSVRDPDPKTMVTRDHVFPVSTNGYNSWPHNNILLAHKKCNGTRATHQVPACALFWLENCSRDRRRFANPTIGVQALKRVKKLVRYKAKVLPNGHAVWEINRDLEATMPLSRSKGGKGQREAP